MISCPNCRNDTTTLTLPVFSQPQAIDVEACEACMLLWFDHSASVGLKPQSVIELFKFIGARAAASRMPLAANFSCPRCTRSLTFTHDLQRSTRFTHWRCPEDKGQLITFHQFLCQKNFVRTPTLAEIAKLRETIRMVTCSQCGAPVDLTRESVCNHCGTAIALIDPDGATKALREYASAASATPDPAVLRAAMAEAGLNAIVARERAWHGNGSEEMDLLAVGAAAVGALLTHLMEDD